MLTQGAMQEVSAQSLGGGSKPQENPVQISGVLAVGSFGMGCKSLSLPNGL